MSDYNASAEGVPIGILGAGNLDMGLAKTVLISTKTGYGVKGRREFYSPRYETAAQRYSPTPDLRTTLYWDPDVTAGVDGIAGFDFYSADTAQSYTVVVEGVTSDGRPVYFRQAIGK